MSDTPTPEFSNVELAMTFAELAKQNGQTDVLVLVCWPTKETGTFERCAYVDGDATKVLSTLAAFVREKVPPHLRAVLLKLIKQAPAEEPQPITPTPWVN